MRRRTAERCRDNFLAVSLTVRNTGGHDSVSPARPSNGHRHLWSCGIADDRKLLDLAAFPACVILGPDSLRAGVRISASALIRSATFDRQSVPPPTPYAAHRGRQ